MRFANIRHRLFPLLLLSVSATAYAQIGIGISVNFGPPPLPVYEQPMCVEDGAIWTPGYWAWDGSDYYWVPGTWVLAPQVGFLWTPPYWGWGGSAFIFHEGYWGPHVGFYGGINYGFGYGGIGYEGGRWDGGHFFYNRTVNNVNVTVVHNTYNTTIVNRSDNHVSFNGGAGGINARPSAVEEGYAREQHIQPIAAQTQQMNAARGNRDLHASVNQGRPAIAATERPGAFTGHVVAAQSAGGRYTPPAGRGAGAPTAVTHARELPPLARPAAPSTGNPKTDQKYQQQQQQLYNKQNQERQNLQTQQERQHQSLNTHNAPPAQQQKVEQQHQQQTQQLQQRHTQQTQQLQQRQTPPPAHKK
jgi:hypothetical protein